MYNIITAEDIFTTLDEQKELVNGDEPAKKVLCDLIAESAKNKNLSTSDDLVNHPSHYTHGSIESIDLMEECEGIEAVKHFCICNCHKYLYRHNVKGRDVEDIRKMIWYANKYIELCEKEQK